MAEFVVPLRKEIKDSLAKHMESIRGLHRKGLAKREKEQILLSESAHKQVLTVKKNMHLILNSSARALVTVVISTVSDREFHRQSLCTQMKTAQIPHNVLREVKV